MNYLSSLLMQITKVIAASTKTPAMISTFNGVNSIILLSFHRQMEINSIVPFKNHTTRSNGTPRRMRLYVEHMKQACSYSGLVELFEFLGKQGNDLKKIPHDPVIRQIENIGLRVFIDRDDDLGRPHSGKMLDGS